MMLYLVRHAWAGEHGDPRYPDDSLRPVTREGAKRFRRVARCLARRGMRVDQIFTSPLVRCHQTAEILAAALKGRPKLVPHRGLAPGSQLGELIQATEAIEGEAFAWVGHAPDIGRLAGALVGSQGANLHFAKGAVAGLEFADGLGPAQGMLRFLATAKILGC